MKNRKNDTLMPLSAKGSLNSKRIPKNIMQDKETLYDTMLRLKEQVRNLTVENSKLKAKGIQTESELQRKDRLLAEVIERINSESASSNLVKLQKETHLITALKQKVKTLEDDLTLKNKEISELKKNIKITKFKEYEKQIKVYEEECLRLRNLLKIANEFHKSSVSMSTEKLKQEINKTSTPSNGISENENMESFKQKLEEFKRKITEKDNEIFKLREERLNSAKKPSKEKSDEKMIEKIVNLVRVLLIDNKITAEKFKNELFKNFKDDDEICIKEVIVEISRLIPNFDNENQIKFAKLLIEDSKNISFKEIDKYSHCLISLAKQHLNEILKINYVYTKLEYEKNAKILFEKLKGNLEKFITLNNENKFTYENFSKELSKISIEFTEFEKDIFLYLCFIDSQKIDCLSIKTIVHILEKTQKIENKPEVPLLPLKDEQSENSELKFSELNEYSEKVMMSFTKYIYENEIKLIELFKDYFQTIKIKTFNNENNVQVIKDKEFIDILLKTYYYSQGENEEKLRNELKNLINFLCVNHEKHGNLISFDKLKQTIQFFATDEKMREKAKIYFEKVKKASKKEEKEVCQGEVENNKENYEEKDEDFVENEPVGKEEISKENAKENK